MEAGKVRRPGGEPVQTCIRVSFFIMPSILSLNSGFCIRLCAMFWNAGLLNMLFIALPSKPGGIAGGPDPPAGASAPPRRRRAPAPQDMAGEHMAAAAGATTKSTARRKDILAFVASTFNGSNVFLSMTGKM